MKRYHVAYSRQNDPKSEFKDVVSQIKEHSEGRNPILILFTSSVDDFADVSAEMYRTFPDSTVMGMTSYINFTSNGFSVYGLSAIAIYDGIECESGMLSDIKTYPLRHIANINDAINRIGAAEDVCVVEFTTAFGNCEEIVQDTFRTALKGIDVPVVGSSAGAPDGCDASFVSLNGRIYREACVFVMIHNLNGGFHIFKENLFKPSGEIYKATDVDCEERTVYEYDSRPASSVVANALHVTADRIEDELLMHPVGRVVGDEIYITEVNKSFPDGRMTYYSRIYNNSMVHQLELDDMDSVWKQTAARVHDKVKDFSFALVVNCCARSKYFLQEDRFDDFLSILKKEYGDFFGVSGYGEQMNFEHLNQTMLLVCFE